MNLSFCTICITDDFDRLLERVDHVVFAAAAGARAAAHWQAAAGPPRLPAILMSPALVS